MDSLTGDFGQAFEGDTGTFEANSTESLPVRKDSIEELCNHRARALELYTRAFAMIGEARQAHAKACVGKAYISSFPHDQLRYSDTAPDKFAEMMQTLVDRDMWQAFVLNTPLGSLMDAQERKKFDADLQGKPPEATPDNVFATMSRLAGEAPMIFRRGLVNAFAALCRDYKSHDGFKIGDRIIITWALSVNTIGYLSAYLGTYSEPKLRDVDRVMHVLDGQPAPDYQQGLCAAMRNALCSRPIQWEVKTPYWRAKMFKNGNVHLYPLRSDLVQKANRIIAEHYGMAVGAAPDVAKGKGRGHDPERAYKADFFYTPDAVVSAMVEAAEITADHKTLEPSAGEGHIAKGIISETGRAPDCVELDTTRAETLRGVVGADCVLQASFLELSPVADYDRIVMNPPWSDGQEVFHVEHAMKFLKPGGRLVAVMSPGIQFRSDARYTSLRDLVERMGGTITRLPSGSFKEAGTAVEAVMLVLDAPA